MSKQFKIAILGAIGVIALGVILMINQPSEKELLKGTGAEYNVLQSNNDTFDFGTISMKDGNVTTTFKVKNPTSEPLELYKLYTTCMCTKAKLIVNGKETGPFGMPGHSEITPFSEVLQPNQEADIEVEYDPNAHGPSGVGQIDRSVIIEGMDGKLATLNIKANVTP